MKKLLVIVFIGLFLCVSLVPGITSKTSYVDDTTPPKTSIEMKGTTSPEDNLTFYSPVTIKITAIDDCGMGDIHYILDGNEEIVNGFLVEFVVREIGKHNLEYWGVDAVGNEEIPHHSVEFLITYGPLPDMDITAPEPGFYLFGNKLFNAKEVIIIGAFTIEATVSVHEWTTHVSFYLDGNWIGDDTTSPYSTYCANKHRGLGEIKAIAYDSSMNFMERTLDVYYYKFL